MTSAPVTQPAAPAIGDLIRADQISPTQERISTLDAVRGFALLGILLMNSVAFALEPAAYANLDAGGSESWLDWTIGSLAAVFVDQKMMALFSLLFGVGVALFADRAAAKGRRAGWLSLWRFLLLLGIGIIHSMIWDGDILTVYALCAPIVLLLRNRSPRALYTIAGMLMAASVVSATLFHLSLNNPGAALGEAWAADASGASDLLWGVLLLDGFGRALALMLIGVGLYRTGIVQGDRSSSFYQRMAFWGLGVGVPLAAASLAVNMVSDWSPDWALPAFSLNTLATVPVAMGYLALIVLWRQRNNNRLSDRIDAVGRMALTNYLTQTLISVMLFSTVFEIDQLTRSEIILYVIGVWALQILWSKPWLDRFHYGPAEWLWRAGTYRRLPSLRRSKA